MLSFITRLFIRICFRSNSSEISNNSKTDVLSLLIRKTLVSLPTKEFLIKQQSVCQNCEQNKDYFSRKISAQRKYDLHRYVEISQKINVKMKLC